MLCRHADVPRLGFTIQHNIQIAQEKEASKPCVTSSIEAYAQVQRYYVPQPHALILLLLFQLLLRSSRVAVAYILYLISNNMLLLSSALPS